MMLSASPHHSERVSTHRQEAELITEGYANECTFT